MEIVRVSLQDKVYSKEVFSLCHHPLFSSRICLYLIFGLFFGSEQRAKACVPSSPISALMPTFHPAGLCEAARNPLSETSVALLKPRSFLST